MFHLFNKIVRGNANPIANKTTNDYSYLKKTPRHTSASVTLLGHKISFPDAASFLTAYKGIFENEVYRFESNGSSPVIIDGGANIGLSVIYFKQLYKDAVIHAFEPDQKIFKFLTQNVEVYGYNNINLYNLGLWDTSTTLKFYSEGADGGRISEVDNKHPDKCIEVKVVALRKFLQNKIDFLKLDIEGAEYRVLKDCSDILNNVDKIFMEYHSVVGQEQNLDEILKILKSAGFRYYIQHWEGGILHPFIKRNIYLNMDLMLNVYAFR